MYNGSPGWDLAVVIKRNTGRAWRVYYDSSLAVWPGHPTQRKEKLGGKKKEPKLFECSIFFVVFFFFSF